MREGGRRRQRWVWLEGQLSRKKSQNLRETEAVRNEDFIFCRERGLHLNTLRFSVPGTSLWGDSIGSGNRAPKIRVWGRITDSSVEDTDGGRGMVPPFSEPGVL